MIAQQTTKSTALPEELESPSAKLVYLYIATNGEVTLSDLYEALGLKRLTLYTILRTLQDRDLVEERGDGYATARPA
ncbi:MAG: helix-turn-helix domain-containing protein [Halobacteriaceae archaeon]